MTPPRGAILDRRGRIIAENVPGYSVKLLASSRDSLRAVLARVGRYVPLDTSETTEILRRFAAARYQPIVVFGDATFETVARLEEHRAVLPGLVIQSEPKSLYPDGKAVAHLVGYVSEVTETDLAVPGSVRFGAFYDEELFLFATAENRATFKQNPDRYTRTRVVQHIDEIDRPLVR